MKGHVVYSREQIRRSVAREPYYTFGDIKTRCYIIRRQGQTEV
jgi:hypothetical protein